MSKGNIDVIAAKTDDGKVWLSAEYFPQPGDEGLWNVVLTLDEARYLLDNIEYGIERAEEAAAAPREKG